MMMVLIRLLMKVLLLPVMLVLTVLKIFLRITTEVFSVAAGLLTLVIFGCLVFTLIRHRWGDALILFFMESGVKPLRRRPHSVGMRGSSQPRTMPVSTICRR